MDKIIKSEKSFSISPAKQFRILVVLSICVALILSSYALYVIYQIRFVDSVKVGNVVVTPIPTINDSKLESVLSLFDQKSKNQNSALGLFPSVIDPSK